MLKYIFGLALIFTINAFGQNIKTTSDGTIYRFELANAPFPDEGRANGHTYDNKLYPKEDHYNDSTTLVFIPSYFKPENETDLMVYFHGWRNNVDSVLTKFNLTQQLSASGKQAILVMPEGPKNSPDSYGGKMEKTGVFKNFVAEVFEHLNEALKGNLTPGNIVLCGHSGAYRVMSYILLRGGLTDKIKEVYLFDALYAEVEKYSYWIDHYDGRFINIYTPEGGTKYLSENLMTDLDAWDKKYSLIENDDFSDSQLTDSKIVFIKSALEHNQVVSSGDQLKKFLSTGVLK